MQYPASVAKPENLCTFAALKTKVLLVVCMEAGLESDLSATVSVGDFLTEFSLVTPKEFET